MTVHATPLARKPSTFLSFWKKPRSPIPDTPPESDLVLPTEIWLAILTDIPGYELEGISRVSKRLREIVLPLYFRTQLVFPFVETFAFRWLSATRELSGYQERSIARLNFLCSAHFSPVVRELFVSPYPPGYNRRHRVEHRPVEPVMQRLVGVLPRFSSLRKLVLHFPLCNDTLLSSLASLQLDHFELEMLPTARGDIPIPARKEFLFDRSTSPIQIFPPLALSLRFLFPHSLERLVAGPTGTDTLTRAVLLHPGGLPALHTLDLSLRFAASPHFADALALLPNLASLRLRASPIDGPGVPAFLPGLPGTSIPQLRSYHGPTMLAPALARGRPLITARLWSSHAVSAVSPPSILPPILAQLPPSLEALEIGVTLVTQELLEAIRASFPALRRLSINAHLDAFHPGTVARHTLTPHHPRVPLPPGLPRHLRALRLGAQLPGSVPELGCAARDVLDGFPAGYDPTSWRRWIVDAPWYVVEWVSDDADAVGDLQSIPIAEQADVGADADAAAGMEVAGTLRVEYGEHYFQSFERGTRVSARTVDEAILRIS
ncbi:hypothetical protein FB451DRAFT_1525674 [Mycena latifolia]|nr:hypothetical protein FB451DRAFT_1525674 [Mycena latifolia]